MDRSTIYYYNKNADKLAELYETADMSEIHALLVRFLSEKASLLEIGCGFGRDAAFLLARVQNDDALGRPVKWFSLVMRKSCIELITG
jgi:hypothetical protein